MLWFQFDKPRFNFTDQVKCPSEKYLTPRRRRTKEFHKKSREQGEIETSVGEKKRGPSVFGWDRFIDFYSTYKSAGLFE